MFAVSAKQVKDQLVIRWQLSKFEIPSLRSYPSRWMIHMEAVNPRRFGSVLSEAHLNEF